MYFDCFLYLFVFCKCILIFPCILVFICSSVSLYLCSFVNLYFFWYSAIFFGVLLLCSLMFSPTFWLRVQIGEGRKPPLHSSFKKKARCKERFLTTFCISGRVVWYSWLLKPKWCKTLLRNFLQSPVCPELLVSVSKPIYPFEIYQTSTPTVRAVVAPYHLIVAWDSYAPFSFCPDEDYTGGLLFIVRLTLPHSNYIKQKRVSKVFSPWNSYYYLIQYD